MKRKIASIKRWETGDPRRKWWLALGKNEKLVTVVVAQDELDAWVQARKRT
jgi:hypothetical protein